MTIALTSGARAAQAIIDEQNPGLMLSASTAIDYQRQMQQLLEPQVAMGFRIHRLFRSRAAEDISRRNVWMNFS